MFEYRNNNRKRVILFGLNGFYFFAFVLPITFFIVYETLS